MIIIYFQPYNLSTSEMSPIKPHLDSQSVYLVSSHTTSSSDLVTDYHVFFVTGNPGCIGYYHAFLPLLISGFEDRGLLDVKLHVYGCSAANFVDDNEKYKKGKILGLKGQIEYMEAKWQDYVNLQSLESRDRNGIDQRTRLKVVLMGHSVGAYMCMEILSRWKGREKEVSKQAAAGRPQSTIGEGVKDLEGLQGVEIVGLIGLWPTITEIARSPSGRRLGVSNHVPIHNLKAPFVNKNIVDASNTTISLGNRCFCEGSYPCNTS